MVAERKIILWLYACCFMVFAMAVIGAVTRLTESGLSITEWKPVTGALPPLTHEAWQHQFDLYRQSPEFTQKHFWMELEDFQKIFFWEWLHRLWGRAIGIVYALPLLWFWIRKRIPKRYGAKLSGILALGGLQGIIGWWMVESGLIDRPSVSHFRLAAHLALALIIFSAMWWVALDLKRPSPFTFYERRGGLACLFLLALTIIWGAFTAGLDAGMVYNTFPLMNGSLTPPEAFDTGGLVSQIPWVQFAHRWLAMAAGVSILTLAWRTKDGPLAAMVFIQITLGISTLLTQVHIPLAAAHQGGAIILLALLLKNIHGGKTTRKKGSGSELSANCFPA
ncbi:MAG: COX15/CtaA family protein [Proteobacteria bacterium]|nr:COX15/CtaA family protein [Pseudomonadota bacterium]